MADAQRLPDWETRELEASGGFPVLPDPAKAPGVLREALRRDVENILAGGWKAFGHLDRKVDDPPRWHCDYLVGRDLSTSESAFQLDHRALPAGADIKLIWELSRWNQLVRLAMAAYVLGDERAARKCVDWLEDWVKHNPPYRGWNWISALEVGMRLVQFTWIDALLTKRDERSGLEERLEALRHLILPPHARFAWRYQSFGSSANNHLLGELAGLITATARWPALSRWGASLDALQPLWEPEVLAQFAADGGNKEQALNYQLFSWELCWQARLALRSADRKVHADVDSRLAAAAAFFWEVQSTHEHWDYGDSDDAWATPFFASEANRVREYREWIARSARREALDYWLGEPPIQHHTLGRGAPARTVSEGEWWVFPESGIALRESGYWWLRWDLSPLGYLRTAAHGHLDILHLSMWLKGVAMIIDPGTGAYYADARMRNWLASRAAHNGPCPAGMEIPKRLGPFLWSGHREAAKRTHSSAGDLEASLRQDGTHIGRRVIASADQLGWVVEDSCIGKNGLAAAFTVRWQFAPGSWVKRLSERKFEIHRSGVAMLVEVSDDWSLVELIEPGAGTKTTRLADDESLDGVVSPAFRVVCHAPCLKLIARPLPGLAGTLRTTFSVLATS